jgi:high-affinity K+ transport system ATPase subunit B
LLVCLIPTTIGGLLSAIGIAEWIEYAAQRPRHEWKAVEAAGDVKTLLLIRREPSLWKPAGSQFIPVEGVRDSELADAAQHQVRR